MKNISKIRLGKSDLEVSKLGLGCINFGTTTDEKTSFALMDTYLENGGNFLDTANNYAFWNAGGVGGESEKVIGNWLADRGNRKDIVLATKMGALPKDIASKDFSNMEGLGRQTILEAVDKSLYNLKTDYIDLLYLHVDDFNTPQLETMSTLDELIKAICVCSANDAAVAVAEFVGGSEPVFAEMMNARAAELGKKYL